jgi:hypothetical protein
MSAPISEHHAVDAAQCPDAGLHPPSWAYPTAQRESPQDPPTT